MSEFIRGRTNVTDVYSSDIQYFAQNQELLNEMHDMIYKTVNSRCLR